MNTKEKSYFIHHLFINHVNENEELAVKLNIEIILAFVNLGLISKDLYNKCLDLVKANKFSDIVTVQHLLASDFNIEMKE